MTEKDVLVEQPMDKFAGNEDARKAFQLIKDGKDTFIQGPAGFGKSTLMKAIIEDLEKQKKKVAVLAPTGIAAINAGGMTIHSAMGGGIRPFYIDDQGYNLGDHWLADIDTVFIDEISMVSASVLNRFDRTMRVTRRCNDPFGGIQMVFVGDMAQLPPIESKELIEQYGGRYFFNAPVFDEMFFHLNKVVLKKNYRQDGDEDFMNILDNVRNGYITAFQLDRLNQCVGKRNNEMAFCARNKDSDYINESEFGKLTSKIFTSVAELKGFYPAGTRVPDIIDIREGMKIMFTKNDSAGAYVNGTMGYITKIIKSISGARLIVTVRRDDGAYIEVEKVDFPYHGWGKNKKGETVFGELGTKTQLPFEKAWSVSIHKSQGLTFDKLFIDMGSGAFDFGQTYVALSRCRSLAGLKLSRRLTRLDIKADPIILRYLNT